MLDTDRVTLGGLLDYPNGTEKSPSRPIKNDAVIVRKLHLSRPEDCAALCDLMLSLSPRDRELRFDEYKSDDQIKAHCKKIAANENQIVLASVLASAPEKLMAVVDVQPYDQDRKAELSVAVSPAYRRMGLGLMLIQAVLMESDKRGIHIVLLHIARRNESMIKVAKNIVEQVPGNFFDDAEFQANLRNRSPVLDKFLKREPETLLHIDSGSLRVNHQVSTPLP
jgi:RimJ/RimL family protein N-acetyltransferase